MHHKLQTETSLWDALILFPFPISFPISPSSGVLAFPAPGYDDCHKGVQACHLRLASIEKWELTVLDYSVVQYVRCVHHWNIKSMSLVISIVESGETSGYDICLEWECFLLDPSWMLLLNRKDSIILWGEGQSNCQLAMKRSAYYPPAPGGFVNSPLLCICHLINALFECQLESHLFFS